MADSDSSSATRFDSNEEPKQSDERGQPIYKGTGTETDPYLIEFFPADPRNPMNFSAFRKWLIMFIVTMSVFAVTLTSSAYSASAEQIEKEFGASAELFAAGIALFVLGFAVGPAVWAPLAELFGRRMTYIVSLCMATTFVGATAGCNNIQSILVFRFLSGTCGASPLTNAGGVIADLFPTHHRGLAMSLFATAPFLGPMLGPLFGGFTTSTIGWRWVQGICCIFIGVFWLAGIVLVPETYGPVLLRKLAKQHSRQSGDVYISVIEKDKGKVKPSEVFGRAIKRPWVLLFWEPIVLIASIYLAVLYATLYMFLPAFPIIYSQDRGWSVGITGLAFLGLVVGMFIGLAFIIYDDRHRYMKLGSSATPESRLPPAMVGAITLPIGMFGFAWTNGPSVHWSASIILSAPFGFGCVQVFNSVLSYLLDSYTIYAASVLGATAMLRAFIGAAFPLFTTQMYRNLGIHWASSISAFLTLACLPFPFVMYKYGEKIRMKCKYAHEAAMLMARMQGEEKAEEIKN